MKVQTLLHLNKKISDIEEEIKKDQMAKSEAFEAVFFSFGEDINELCKTEEDVGQAEEQILKKLNQLGLASIMLFISMKRRVPQKRMKSQ